MILDYNATKDGVDNMDEMFASCTCQHVTVSWLLTVFYNITDIHCVMVWNLRRKHPYTEPEHLHKMYRRRRYLEKLGKALVTPQILLRKRLPRPFTSAYFVQTVQSEEQRTSQSIVETKCIPDKILCAIFGGLHSFCYSWMNKLCQAIKLYTVISRSIYKKGKN
ncbi:hypothetical protein T09_9150 [Trichinella sp. T9]|nr:hypothetical protein T09_9150 [Trichinella sp. T9]